MILPTLFAKAYVCTDTLGEGPAGSNGETPSLDGTGKRRRISTGEETAPVAADTGAPAPDVPVPDVSDISGDTGDDDAGERADTDDVVAAILGGVERGEGDVVAGEPVTAAPVAFPALNREPGALDAIRAAYMPLAEADLRRAIGLLRAERCVFAGAPTPAVVQFRACAHAATIRRRATARCCATTAVISASTLSGRPSSATLRISCSTAVSACTPVRCVATCVDLYSRTRTDNPFHRIYCAEIVLADKETERVRLETRDIIRHADSIARQTAAFARANAELRIQDAEYTREVARLRQELEELNERERRVREESRARADVRAAARAVERTRAAVFGSTRAAAGMAVEQLDTSRLPTGTLFRLLTGRDVEPADYYALLLLDSDTHAQPAMPGVSKVCGPLCARVLNWFCLAMGVHSMRVSCALQVRLDRLAPVRPASPAPEDACVICLEHVELRAPVRVYDTASFPVTTAYARTHARHTHNTQVRTLPCGHTYHAACIEQWLTHKTTCPSCRSRVKAPSARPTAH